MNNLFHIISNLASALGLTLGFALIASTEAREFILQHGSSLVAMVFPLAIMIMLLQTSCDQRRARYPAKMPAPKRVPEIARERRQDPIQQNVKDDVFFPRK